MLKKVLALTLTLALCLSLSSVAFAAGFEGEADLKVPLYTVVVPNNFRDMVYIDAIEIGGAGQLYCGDNGFVFANKTPVPVLINIEVTMTAAATSGITLVDSPEDVTTGLNPPADEKNVYLGIEAPVGMGVATGGVTDPGLGETDIESTFGVGDAKVIVPFDVEDDKTAKTAFSLVLETGVDAESNDVSGSAGTGNDNYATDVNSLGAFKFYADLTTYNTTWAKNDLSFDGVYEFQGLRAADYTEALDAKVEGSLNLYQGAGAAGPTFTKTGFIVSDDIEDSPYTLTSAVSNKAPLVIPFYLHDTDTITKVTWNAGNTDMVGYWTSDKENNILTINNTFSSFSSAVGARFITITAGGTTYVYNFTAHA